MYKTSDIHKINFNCTVLQRRQMEIVKKCMESKNRRFLEEINIILFFVITFSIVRIYI